ncbi:hypothetical protein T05_5595 [Trichinella murrelli]|uniref:Uncharacterized protein n=1 Tax=Trichinella murrelli TaxID=144512 RepID=A0A0V0U592_9BILA|nr:hypothetical protein T05_5595 [Trichinella murrelli]
MEKASTKSLHRNNLSIICIVYKKTKNLKLLLMKHTKQEAAGGENSCFGRNLGLEKCGENPLFTVAHIPSDVFTTHRLLLKRITSRCDR